MKTYLVTLEDNAGHVSEVEIQSLQEPEIGVFARFIRSRKYEPYRFVCGIVIMFQEVLTND
jgi:hypothetical protein